MKSLINSSANNKEFEVWRDFLGDVNLLKMWVCVLGKGNCLPSSGFQKSARLSS